MAGEAKPHEKLAVRSFFVLGAILLIAALLVTGVWHRLFTSRDTFHIAFPESVIGLNVGAPVTNYGVQVGEVTALLPMEDPEAERIVRSAPWIILPDAEIRVTTQGKAQYAAWTAAQPAGPGGRPFVLVTVEVKRDSISLNEQTCAMLELVNIAGAYAIRVESHRNGATPCGPGSVVLARKSSFADLKERLWDPQTGFLSQRNADNIRELLGNVREISEVLHGVIGDQKEQLKRILQAQAAIAATMQSWTEDGGKLAVVIERVDSVARNLARLTGEDGEVTRLANDADRLTNDVDHLVRPQGDVPALVATLNDLGHELKRVSGEFQKVAGSADRLMSENRLRVATLLEDVDRLARRVDSVAVQIGQDPSSAVFGRRGPELMPTR